MKSSVEHLQKVKDIIESQINISPAVQGYFVKEQTVNNKVRVKKTYIYRWCGSFKTQSICHNLNK